MAYPRDLKYLLPAIALFIATLLFEACDSRTPVEYDNPHDPLSAKYLPRTTAAPFNLRFTAVTDSRISIAWQDTNKLLNFERLQAYFILDKSVNGGSFSELARLGPNSSSYADNTPVDTLSVYRYRIKLVTPFDTSLCSSTLSIQHTVVDAEIIRTLDLGAPINSLTLSPDGSMLAVSGGSFRHRVWQLGDDGSVGDSKNFGSYPWTVNPGWLINAAFSSDCKLIAGNAENESVNIWRVSDGQRVGAIYIGRSHGGDATSISFSPDGAKLVTGGIYGAVCVWDLVSGSLVTSFKPFSYPPEVMIDLLYSTRDGAKTIVGGYDVASGYSCGIQIRQTSNLSLVERSFDFTSYSLTMSLDESHVACGGSILSLETGSIVRSFSGYEGKSALTYDNRFLVLQQWDGKLLVGQVSDGTTRLARIYPIAVPGDSHPAVLCLPNRHEFFATSSSYGKVDQWRLKLGWTNQ